MDKRFGFVFVYLDANATLLRYQEQLGSVSGDQSPFAQFNKVRTILINERYVNGSDADVMLAKNIILVDSKGVDASTIGNGDLDALWTEVKAFQFFAKISDLTLFLMPAHEIRNCEPAISVFELSIVCSEEGIAILKKQQQQQDRASSSTVTGGGSGVVRFDSSVRSTGRASGDPLGGLLLRMLGLDSIYGAAKSVGASLASQVKKYFLPSPSAQDMERGTARWQKTFFVLSRVDEVLRSDDPVAESSRVAEFQVGKSI